MTRRGRPSDAELKAQLAELHALRTGAPEATDLLARALASPSSFVVEAAARIIGEQDLHGHETALAAAFARFADGGAATDPSCKAKIAVVEALVRLGIDDAEVYRRGVRLRQPEPVYGGRVDTAVAVRVHCAAGLAQASHPAAAVAAAELLADREWDARAGAARALGLCRREVAEPVLRHKLLSGDQEVAVVGECMRSLLALAPDAMPLVVDQLGDADPGVAEQAALALGESRLDDAFAALRSYLEGEPTRARRRPALVAMALLRRDVAIDYLVALIAEADGATAVAAAEALDIYKHDAKMVERIRAAQRRRKA